MLLARATTRSGDDVLVIGLSKENRKRLNDGQPIDITTFIQGAGGPQELHLVLFGGIDEATMEEELTRFMGPIMTPTPRAPINGSAGHGSKPKRGVA